MFRITEFSGKKDVKKIDFFHGKIPYIMASHRIAIGKNDNAQEPINNRLGDPTKLFNSYSPYTLYIGFLLLGCRTDRFENVFYPAFYRGGGRSQS